MRALGFMLKFDRRFRFSFQMILRGIYFDLTILEFLTFCTNHPIEQLIHQTTLRIAILSFDFTLSWLLNLALPF